MLTLATKAALLSAVSVVIMGCALHPSLTIPDHAVTINGCTYQAYRYTNSRTNTEWVLRHSDQCTHTRYHLHHMIYVDTLQPITTRPNHAPPRLPLP